MTNCDFFVFGDSFESLVDYFESLSLPTVWFSLNQRAKDRKVVVPNGRPEFIEETVDVSYVKNWVKNEIIVCIASSYELETNLLLKTLAQFSDKTLIVWVIDSTDEFLTVQQKLQKKAVCNVLQQYARSGKFHRLFQIEKEKVEEIIGDIPILQFDSIFGSTVGWFVISATNCEFNEPVKEIGVDIRSIDRISTISIGDFEKNTHTMLASLLSVEHACYNVLVNEGRLSTDRTLMKRTKEVFRWTENKSKIKIFATTTEEDKILAIYSTHLTNN